MPAKTTSAEIRVAAAARLVADQRRHELENLKGGAKKWDEPDWIWESLLLSAGTLGNSRGHKLVHDPKIHSKVRFDVLRRLSPKKRRTTIELALRTATALRSSLKAEWLTVNFAKIVADGGTASIQDRLTACQGIAAKLRFLQTFKGIGPKYSRNIMMDVYHPDFREFIAVDVRIKSVSAKLGVTFNGYPDEQQFYLRAAHRAGLSGWEMDRVIYNFKEEVISELDSG